VLGTGNDLSLAHQRFRFLKGGEALGVLEVDALGAFEEQEEESTS